MATAYNTPGVYIVENNAFPNSVTAVETAIPVFIGYTEKAEAEGKSLLQQPVKINSLDDYHALFGKNLTAKFVINTASNHDAASNHLNINGTGILLRLKENHAFYLYNTIRLFYANGGGRCYILSAGVYGDNPDQFMPGINDFTGTAAHPGPLETLLQEPEPSLIIIPDAVIFGEDCYNTIYKQVLLHCRQVQNRFALFDLVQQHTADQTDELITNFRNNIGTEGLNYGAAYYPWLNTTVVSASEAGIDNFDDPAQLAGLLAEPEAKAILGRYLSAAQLTDEDKAQYHHLLMTVSTTYAQLINEVVRQLNQLPPAGAIAGVFAAVDASRGVWKAPANIALNAVTQPAFPVDDDVQALLSGEASGKAVNALRAFEGMGTLVWGARTLDSNSADWRYINVRRTVIMIEQSVKLAMRVCVFEPNNTTTWVTVKDAVSGFLLNLWKQGALAGSVPAEAYDVNIGLNTTMTAEDIQNGIMNLTIKLAISRPAEFIILTIQQQMTPN